MDTNKIVLECNVICIGKKDSNAGYNIAVKDFPCFCWANQIHNASFDMEYEISS